MTIPRGGPRRQRHLVVTSEPARIHAGVTVGDVSNERPSHVVGDDDRASGRDRPRRPRLVILDVNETLSDMSSMAQRFEDVGAPAHLATTWFATLLRDGFALTAVESSNTFAHIATESLLVSLHGLALDRAAPEAVSHIMEGFGGLPVHADVPDGIAALRGGGFRLVTLSNGSSSVAESLFVRAGIRDHFERLLTVEDVGLWKPAPEAYAYALQQCEVDSPDAMLVAVHPWDIDGAARAGLATAWVEQVWEPVPELLHDSGSSSRVPDGSRPAAELSAPRARLSPVTSPQSMAGRCASRLSCSGHCRAPGHGETCRS